jgi:hypothetical protein
MRQLQREFTRSPSPDILRVIVLFFSCRIYLYRMLSVPTSDLYFSDHLLTSPLGKIRWLSIQGNPRRVAQIYS